ncbi:DUF3969 family protein [Neisseria yangbaofengii]|uniref:DUF3969 family protein n=1 Tax=Neisseria yangbaofengii TaxID=2709396 RepID=UPI0013EDB6D0|nr:DUF3969 family protein [Neisseria yangbaofengii]
MKTNLNLFTQNKQDAEFFLNTFVLGALILLHKKKLSIYDTEKLIFRLGVVEYLNNISFDKEIVDLIMLGTELEDVESLVPEQLDVEIKKLIDMAMTNLSSKKLSDNISIYIEPVCLEK